MRLLVLLALVGCSDTEPDPPGPPWTQGPDLPDGERRLEASAVGQGGRVLVIGGFVTSDREVPPLEITRAIWQFDPRTDVWSRFPVEAPVAWTHANVASVGGSLYLLGGLEGAAFTPSGRAFRLRPGAMTWEELAPMPVGRERGASAVVVTTGHIFLFGGDAPGGATASVLDYSVATNTWAELPALPTPRSHAAASRREDGTFFVAGGLAEQGVLGDVYALRLGSQTWELRAPMPTPRAGCAYGELFGELVCAGGDQGGAASRAVESYDPTLNEWTVLPELPVERAGAPGAIATSRLFVIGGSPSMAFEPTSTLFELDVLATIPR